ncbi:hypothetical protein NDU88_010741 [Pleurodeles waltl]|uniref:Uncharacterized protein n=1 Tax=Pleurodeles waltl TaxID=8319 RepID=A0AAV7QY71_PLEWA|nr:hypothetical protein NDU88_010741 [Pleurodeles waltl]
MCVMMVGKAITARFFGHIARGHHIQGPRLSQRRLARERGGRERQAPRPPPYNKAAADWLKWSAARMHCLIRSAEGAHEEDDFPLGQMTLLNQWERREHFQVPWTTEPVSRVKYARVAFHSCLQERGPGGIHIKGILSGMQSKGVLSGTQYHSDDEIMNIFEEVMQKDEIFD